MVTRSETLKIRVTPNEKEEILEYMDDTKEASTISDFGRLTLLKHVRNDDDEVSIDQTDIIDAVDVAIADVHERLERVETHVVSIDSQTSLDDDVDKLARDIYHSLPVHEEGDMPSLYDAALSGLDDDFSKAQKISSPSAWAEYFGEDISLIRRACATMLEYYPDATFVREDLGESMEIEGSTVDTGVAERRFYKTSERGEAE